MQPSDNRLIFYEPVPNLQDMAASYIAINWTMNYTERVMKSNVNLLVLNSKLTIFQKNQNQIYETKPDNLIIPWVIEAKIREKIFDCCDEIENFLQFYEDFNSFDIKVVARLKEFLSNIVWKSSGKIDHLHTAFNLLNSSSLNKLIRFQVMCEFCMEEKIREAWSKMRNVLFVQASIFTTQPLLAYWRSVMTGDFSKISNFLIVAMKKQVLLSLRERSARFPVLEYFFNRLDFKNRIEIGSCLMQNWGGWTRFLISKFTEHEQYQLFSTSNDVVHIFCAFLRDMSKYPDDVIKLWNHIKNFVNGNQYVEILRIIGKWRRNYEVLEEFWRSTPCNLKEYAFKLENEDVLRKFSIHPYKDFLSGINDALVQRDDRILIAVLTDANREYRKRFWSRELEKIVCRSQPSKLKRVLSLCVPIDEMTEFKRNVMSASFFRNYLANIIILGKFQILNEFLSMFIDGGQREIDDVKKELFENTSVHYSSMYSVIACCDETEQSVSDLFEFLKIKFRNDESGEGRIQMILECFNNSENEIRRNICRIIFVSNRICDVSLLNKVKYKVMMKCKMLLSTKDGYRNIRRNEWNEILLWCLGNQKYVEGFETWCRYSLEQAKERAKRR